MRIIVTIFARRQRSADAVPMQIEHRFGIIIIDANNLNAIPGNNTCINSSPNVGSITGKGLYYPIDGTINNTSKKVLYQSWGSGEGLKEGLGFCLALNPCSLYK